MLSSPRFIPRRDLYTYIGKSILKKTRRQSMRCGFGEVAHSMSGDANVCHYEEGKHGIRHKKNHLQLTLACQTAQPAGTWEGVAPFESFPFALSLGLLQTNHERASLFLQCIHSRMHMKFNTSKSSLNSFTKIVQYSY